MVNSIFPTHDAVYTFKMTVPANYRGQVQKHVMISPNTEVVCKSNVASLVANKEEIILL
jgi:hypothetical protein